MLSEQGRTIDQAKKWRAEAQLPEKTTAVDAQLPYPERVRALAKHAQADSIVFQSAAVGALQLLDRVLWHEQQVAEAAISLAQREKLQEMIRALEDTVEALRETLSAQGSQMLNLCEPGEEENAGERSWWFALTEAIHVLEEGTEWIASVVSGQPKGGAARTLSSIIARLLHRHHNALLDEAEQWIT